METRSKRPGWPILALASVFVLVALTATASVIGGSSAAAETTQSPPLQTQPVQESQATPAPQGERRARGNREDCPEKDGRGQGAVEPGNQSAAPDGSSATPDV